MDSFLRSGRIQGKVRQNDNPKMATPPIPTNIVLDKQNWKCLPVNVSPLGQGLSSSLNCKVLRFFSLYYLTNWFAYLIRANTKPKARRGEGITRAAGFEFACIDTQAGYAGINFIRNHPPPPHPRGFAPKICPHPGAFAGGGRDLLG